MGTGSNNRRRRERPAPLHVGWPGLDELAMKLAADRAAAEQDVVAAVVCDHPRGVAVAQAEGLTQCHFDHEDLRLIWLACRVAHNRPLIAVLKLARQSLCRAGFWFPQGPIHRGSMSQWNDESLARLATNTFPSESLVRVQARQLMAIDQRQRQAAAKLTELVALLAGPDEPGASAEADRADGAGPRPSVRVRRKKGEAA